MQKLTIVFVINRLKLGGAQRVVITLAQAMREMGHDTHIICFKRGEELVGAENLTVHHFHRGLAFLPPALRNRLLARKLDDYVRKNIGTPDIVLSNLSKANRILIHSALPNVHIIVHNTLSISGESPAGAALQRWLRLQRLRSVYMRKPCIACGDGVYDDFLSLMPDHPSITRIFNPIDVEQTKAWSEETPSPFEKYVVHLGSFIPQKRHDILLQAYKAAGIEEALVLVGSGELESEIRQQAVQLGIEDKVIFAGFRSNPYPILAGATVMLLTSDYEGLAVVLLESLALGVPIVSTDCDSGPREVLPQSNLAPVGDVEAIAAKIRQAVATPGQFVAPLPEKLDSRAVAAEYLKLINHED